MAIKQRTKSLQSRADGLSNTFIQLDVLQGKTLTEATFPSFGERVGALQPSRTEIFQVNLGKQCNQSCAHCHVDAAPDREEIMSRDTMEQCLAVLAASGVATVDITGGAPELNPNFRWFVESCVQLGKRVMNRCNLTIIVANPRFHDLPEFFAANRVHIVSSLPHYSANRTDSQRGEGVFQDSIRALQMLNAVGYGQEGTGLQLDLVYNPSGAFLPSGQQALERDFKQQLKRKFDIDFNNLFAITNMPISRFLEYLLASNNYERYMTTLVQAFNPATVANLMCRNTISVGWDGYLYDCDFNQMLDLRVAAPCQHISALDWQQLAQRSIVLNQHCYGCTAGAGSSCGGEVV